MTDEPTPNPFSRRAFLGLAAVGGLAACSGGQSAQEAAGGGAEPAETFTAAYDGPPVELSYWNGFTGGDGPFMQQMVADFQKEFPNITIKNNTVQWAEYYQRMPAATTAGSGPDVGVMHVDQLATNAARRIIVPVDDLAEALGLSEADFTADVWQAGLYKDQRYGIPLDVHSLAMFTNTGLTQKAGVAEPPADRESFEAALDRMKAAGQANPFWMPSRWPAHLMFLSLLWQNGGEPYERDGSKATFDSEQGVAALTWMVDQIKAGNSPRNVAQDSQYVAFKNNQVPVTWDGIWQINDLKATKVPFALAPLPQIGEQRAAWANSHNFYITKQATADENKGQASRVFIDWISKRSAEWAGAGMVPARKSVREGAEVQATTQAPIADQIDTLKFLPPVPGLGDVQAQTLEIAVAEATLLRKAPADALKEQASRATRVMQDNLKKFGG